MEFIKGNKEKKGKQKTLKTNCKDPPPQSRLVPARADTGHRDQVDSC